MRIRTRIFLDPDANVAYGVFAIAISLFAFAYSLIFGKVAILAFYGVWLPPLLLAPRLLLEHPARLLPVLALLALCLLSTAWSDRPGVTLRAGVQFGSTIVCGVIAARILAVPVLTLGGLAGSALILLYSFAIGQTGYDVTDGSQGFAGAFGSKNQLGMYASLGLIFSFGPLFLFRVRRLWQAAALLVLALSALALVMADSATATITVAMAFAVMAGARLSFALPSTPRLVLVGLGTLVALVISASAYTGGLEAEFLGLFERDTTLTGRTYLWSVGLRFGTELAPLGLGYYAFWTQGRDEAEVLWHIFYVASRGGFHFHNTFIEAYVALGFLGVAAVFGIWLSLIVLSAAVLLNREFVGSAIVCIGLSLLFVCRAWVEVEFFHPYGASTFLVAYLIESMLDQRSGERAGLLEAPPDGEELTDAAGPT